MEDYLEIVFYVLFFVVRLLFGSFVRCFFNGVLCWLS